jgi:small subunit ribosomal protein S16
MAVKIRMTRMGRRHRPFFRINAIDSRCSRDGKILEKLGHYDPVEKDKEKQIVLNVERIRYWLDKGAIPSDTVSDMFSTAGIAHKQAEKRAAKLEKARTIAKAKGKLFNTAQKVAAEKVAEKAKAEAERIEAEKAKAAEEKAKAEAEKKAKAEEAKAAAEAEKAKAEETKAEESAE